MQIEKVKVCWDDSGHLYIIPNSRHLEFLADLDDDEMCESGKFSKKWNTYMTSGINDVQLYATIS